MRPSPGKITLPTAVAILLALSACQPPLTSPPAALPLSPSTSPVPASTLSPATVTFTPAPARTAALSELLNQVKARMISGADWEAATDGQRLHVGGGARTGDESRARMDISDGTIIRMAANSEFELMELSGESADAVTRLTLAAGKLWMLVQVALGAVFEIETPAGSATVRGSFMSVEYSDATGQMIVTCLEGQCRLTGTSGAFTDLRDGQQAEIPSVGADPLPEEPMTAAQYADWAENFPGAPAPTATPTSTESSTMTPAATIAISTSATSLPAPAATGRPTLLPTVAPAPPSTPQIVFLRPSCGTTYTVQADRPLEIRYGSWIAIGADLARQNAQHLTVRLVLDGEPVAGVQQPVAPISAFPCATPLADAYGIFYVTQVGPLSAGTHIASVTWILDEQVTDGYDANGDGAPELYGPGEISTREFTIIAQ